MQYIEAKSILTKYKEPDSWFGLSYGMNLYRGCQHGCIYCDTRSDCYQVGDISTIRVKRNALQLLERELSSKRRRGTIGTGSMNDPYMPVEKQTELVRGALEIIARHKFPVHVITKGNLVTRDTDLLQQISNTYAAVSFTITTSDNELARRLEPAASLTSQRFEAMAHLAANGIYTGVTLMPLLPFINDSEENVREIVRRAADNGASYILPAFGVTLRKGSRDYFYRALDKQFPDLKARYDAAFGDQYICPSYNEQRLNDCFMEETERLGLDRKIKFYELPKIDSEQLSLF